MKQRSKLVLGVLLGSFFLFQSLNISQLAYGHFNPKIGAWTDTYGNSIGKPTTLCYKLSKEMEDDPIWKGWILAAIDRWNQLKDKTGWEFVPCPDDYIDKETYSHLDPYKEGKGAKVADISFRFAKQGEPVEGGSSATTPSQDGWALYREEVLIVKDLTTTLGKQASGGYNGTGWDITGATTMDPVLVVEHELGHCMRLDHPTDGTTHDTGNVEDPFTVGDHNKPPGRGPSASDISEAKKAADDSNPKPNGTKSNQTANGTKTIGMVPGWIKNTAEWWSEGESSDKEFAQAIGYLVEKNVISIESRSSVDSAIIVSDDIKIPQWIKNNASWWASGAISDAEFLKGIQYMLENNIISFSNYNVKTQISTSSLVTITVTDKSGDPVDAMVMISGHSGQLTNRDGQASFSLMPGTYTVTIDSSNFKRLTENILVGGDTRQTFELEPISSQETTTTSPTAPEATPTTTPSTTLQISVTPPSSSFTHTIGSSPCPTSVTMVTLQSNQEGTWKIISSPGWTAVTIQGNSAKIDFNCILNQYVSQSLFGDVNFEFTSMSGQTGSVSMHVTGQIIK